MVAPHFLGPAWHFRGKYVHSVQACMSGKSNWSSITNDALAVQERIVWSSFTRLATAEGSTPRGFHTPTDHSHAFALHIEASMCCMWDSSPTYILLSMWKQVHVFDRRVLPKPSRSIGTMPVVFWMLCTCFDCEITFHWNIVVFDELYFLIYCTFFSFTVHPISSQ